MSITKTTCIVLLVLVLIVVSPLMAIWSLNTLFDLEIPYQFRTWAAMLVILGSFGRMYSTDNK